MGLSAYPSVPILESSLIPERHAVCGSVGFKVGLAVGFEVGFVVAIVRGDTVIGDGVEFRIGLPVGVLPNVRIFGS